ncbi:MAG: hypothetical protein AAGE76_10510 [Pseudomonadota bacterium]
MINVIAHPRARAPDLSIDRVIHQHGPWPVLTAALRALLTRRPRRTAALPLSPHLRRDIGIAPAHEAGPAWARHI